MRHNECEIRMRGALYSSVQYIAEDYAYGSLCPVPIIYLHLVPPILECEPHSTPRSVGNLLQSQPLVESFAVRIPWVKTQPQRLQAFLFLQIFYGPANHLFPPSLTLICRQNIDVKMRRAERDLVFVCGVRVVYDTDVVFVHGSQVTQMGWRVLRNLCIDGGEWVFFEPRWYPFLLEGRFERTSVETVEDITHYRSFALLP